MQNPAVPAKAGTPFAELMDILSNVTAKDKRALLLYLLIALLCASFFAAGIFVSRPSATIDTESQSQATYQLSGYLLQRPAENYQVGQ